MLGSKLKQEDVLALLAQNKGRRRSAITVLDIDGDLLRVVQGSLSGRTARVTGIFCGKIVWDEKRKGDATADANSIAATLRELGLKPREIVFAIPRGQVVLRPMQTPVVADPRELAALVYFQAAKDLPFRLDEAVVDFKVLRLIPAESAAVSGDPQESASSPEAAEPEAGAPRLEMLVGAVKSEIVRYYRDLSKGLGMKLIGLALRSLGIARSVESRALEDGARAILLINLRREEITIDIVAQKKLVFSRVAAVQFPEQSAGAAPESFLSNLAVEVVRTLHSYEGDASHPPVGQLFVSGVTGLETSVMETLSSRLHLPGNFLQPDDSIELRNADRAEAPPAMAAIGLVLSALEPGGLQVDFANPKRPPVQRDTRRLKVLGLAALIVVLFIGLFSLRAHLLKKRQQIRQQAQQELLEAEKKLPIYRRLKSQNKVVQAWMAEEKNWLDHLAYLSAFLPGAEDIYVSAINVTPQHLIRISVQAKSGELLAQLDRKIRAAGYEVKPLSITPANDKHGYNFRTTIELSVPRKLKPDWSKIKPPPRPADDAGNKTAARHGSSGGQRA